MFSKENNTSEFILQYIIESTILYQTLLDQCSPADAWNLSRMTWFNSKLTSVSWSFISVFCGLKCLYLMFHSCCDFNLEEFCRDLLLLCKWCVQRTAEDLTKNIDVQSFFYVVLLWKISIRHIHHISNMLKKKFFQECSGTAWSMITWMA